MSLNRDWSNSWLYVPLIIYGDLSVEGRCLQGEYGGNVVKKVSDGRLWEGQNGVSEAIPPDVDTPVTWQKHFRGDNEQL